MEFYKLTLTKTYAYISSDSVYEVSSWAAESWKPGSEQIVAETASLRPSDNSTRKRLRKADDYSEPCPGLIWSCAWRSLGMFSYFFGAQDQS